MGIQPKQSGNMMCLERVQQREYAQHQQRLATLKPRVDNKQPPEFSFLTQRSKQDQMRREKFEKVEIENRRLVNSMTKIMKEGGRVDNKLPFIPSGYRGAARTRWEKEQRKIHEDNLKLLKKLQTVKPTYSQERFFADRRANETYAARVSRYPFKPLDTYPNHGMSRMDAY